jgi:propanol-preferring alcohol dehydrogenase
MVLDSPHQQLHARDISVPVPGPGQLLLQISACGVCRTDLHVVDGELEHPKSPLVPGHEIVGTVRACGFGSSASLVGRRVGIPWLGWTCGQCEYCRTGRENLCDYAKFTGYTLDGGYAEYTVADERFCVPIPDQYDDTSAAPLLCAGLIGYRCLVMAGAAERLGIYGFGAAAHIIAQVARHQGRQIYAFTRPGDSAAQDFARSLGAAWAGGSDERPPVALDAAILFATVGALVPLALAAVRKGGTVVCGGIHMSDIPAFPYSLLWGERRIVSVANLTRADAHEFMQVADKFPIHTTVEIYPLVEANTALDHLRTGRLKGAAVLRPQL